jgi:hypothetical protein
VKERNGQLSIFLLMLGFCCYFLGQLDEAASLRWVHTPLALACKQIHVYVLAYTTAALIKATFRLFVLVWTDDLEAVRPILEDIGTGMKMEVNAIFFNVIIAYVVLLSQIPQEQHRIRLIVKRWEECDSTWILYLLGYLMAMMLLQLLLIWNCLLKIAEDFSPSYLVPAVFIWYAVFLVAVGYTVSFPDLGPVEWVRRRVHPWDMNNDVE